MTEVTYPLSVLFHEDDEEWELATAIEAAVSLEWFDSDDPDEKASVTDAKGRSVRIKVEKHVIVLLELQEIP